MMSCKSPVFVSVITLKKVGAYYIRTPSSERKKEM